MAMILPVPGRKRKKRSLGRLQKSFSKHVSSKCEGATLAGHVATEFLDLAATVTGLSGCAEQFAICNAIKSVMTWLDIRETILPELMMNSEGLLPFVSGVECVTLFPECAYQK